MKPEEAIDIIKRMHKGAPTTDQYEALELAYEAFEKQTKKVALRICGAMGEKYECPECGSGLRDTDLFAGHCKWCGQAIRENNNFTIRLEDISEVLQNPEQEN